MFVLVGGELFVFHGDEVFDDFVGEGVFEGCFFLLHFVPDGVDFLSLGVFDSFFVVFFKFAVDLFFLLELTDYVEGFVDFFPFGFLFSDVGDQETDALLFVYF